MEPVTTINPNINGDGSLYYECIPIRIKSVDREQFTENVFVKVTKNDPYESKKAGGLAGGEGGTRVNGQSDFFSSAEHLNIELTTESDPFFLYATEVNEQIFHRIKSEQHILVDFQTFPQKFVELLESCHQGIKEPTSETTYPGSYLSVTTNVRLSAVLVLGPGGVEANLCIVESNQFREITHLSLKLHKGSDEYLKNHLAYRMNRYKAYSSSLENSINRLQDKLNEVNDALKFSQNTLVSLNADVNRNIGKIEIDKQQEITSLKDNFFGEMDSLKKAHLEEVTHLRNTLEAQISSLKENLNQTHVEKDQTLNTRNSLEVQLKELEKTHEFLLQDNKRNEGLVQTLRKNNQSLEETKFEHEKRVTELSLRLAAVQENLSVKEELINNSSKLATQTASQKETLEETMSVLKKQNQKYESKLKLSIEEINKGNTIISKLQSQLKLQKQRVKEKAELITTNEDIITKERNEIHSLKNIISELQTSATNKENEINRLTKQNDELSAQLNEAHKLLTSNQQVIDYLNKELTNKEISTIVSRYGSTTAGAIQGTRLEKPQPFAYPAGSYTQGRSLNELLANVGTAPAPMHNAKENVQQFDFNNSTDANRTLMLSKFQQNNELRSELPSFPKFNSKITETEPMRTAAGMKLDDNGPPMKADLRSCDIDPASVLANYTLPQQNLGARPNRTQVKYMPP